MEESKESRSKNILQRSLKITLAGGIILMLIKLAAYAITHSNAILTDALESVINLAAGVFALFSIYFAHRPRDLNHPYGHGKIEFFAAGFEGGLISAAGVAMAIRAIASFFIPPTLHHLDIGILLTFIGGLGNGVMGYWLLKIGKKYHSLTLEADGKHLLSDTYSSIALLIGLVLMQWGKWHYLDGIISLILSLIILITGFKLIRHSISGLMDEVSPEKIDPFISYIQKNRKPNWIDLHNLRLLNYGTYLHVDFHLTCPYFLTVEEVYDEVKEIEGIIRANQNREVEFFITTEPCTTNSCALCKVENCPKRAKPFEEEVIWTAKSTFRDAQHELRK